ncbi:hypothetical protein [Thalassotalea sp. ND16A]|uniref:hypothetical protein n=1 Tax=Thalassotalea sp. ND16A TaxID=1535422 RepID=UPI00051A86E7|nr:hypothetical protein [Thalassotalea sp. ND16A]KGJ87527.1 hypothetical protein ND16A_2910 [Thalassotalea sp. ND16A]
MRKLVYSIVLILLSACASTGGEQAIAIPSAQPRANVFVNDKQVERKYDIVYQTDAQGNPLFQQTWTEVTVVGGEKDSLASLSEFAKQKAKLLAVEEVNGVLIEDKTQINTVSVRNQNNQYSYQDMQSESVNEVLGIGKVKKQQCDSSLTQDNTIKLTCKVLVEVPKIKQIKAI